MDYSVRREAGFATPQGLNMPYFCAIVEKRMCVHSINERGRYYECDADKKTVLLADHLGTVV